MVWSYSGVRPLLDDESGDPSAVTRDYSLELDTAHGAPLLSVWGGKITTFRKLAEEAADLLAAPLRRDSAAPGPHGAFLPGGDLAPAIGAPQRPDTDFERFVQALARRHPELPGALLRRLARAYGARVELLLADGRLGAEVAPGLFEAELDYLHRTNGRAAPTTCCGAAASSACTTTTPSAPRWRAWCAARWTRRRRRPVDGDGMELKLEAHRAAGRARPRTCTRST